jgi:predicted SprT family Zn-dependent metalloprotease
MNNSINNLLQDIITEAKNINIPVGNINPIVKINTRATKRMGQCCRRGDKYFIQISSFIITEDKKAVKETLAHEILHTVYGCFNHGEKWKYYAEKMGRKYGYDITRTKNIASLGTLGIIKPITNHLTNYTIKCQGCDQVIHRHRKSKLTQYPHLYRCGKCGGKLVLV